MHFICCFNEIISFSVGLICFSRGLRRSTEYIKKLPKADKLVANVKRVFKKAPYRALEFLITDAPNITLTP